MTNRKGKKYGNIPSYMECTNYAKTRKDERNNGRPRQSESGRSGSAGNSLARTRKEIKKIFPSSTVAPKRERVDMGQDSL